MNKFEQPPFIENILVDGQLYQVGGEVLRAHVNEETGEASMSVYMGYSGTTVNLLGYVIDETGQMYKRIYNVEDEQPYQLDEPSSHVSQLQEINIEDLEPRLPQSSFGALDDSIWDKKS